MYQLSLALLCITLVVIALGIIGHIFNGNFKLFYSGYLYPFFLKIIRICLSVGKYIYQVIDYVIKKSNLLGHQDRMKESERIKYLNDINSSKSNFLKSVLSTFLVEACSRCDEYEMQLIGFSPNARSVEYACVSCGKKKYSSAGSPDSKETVEKLEALFDKINDYNAKYPNYLISSSIFFKATPFPLPYEKVSREPIKSHIASIIWRRDNGRCVQCGTNQNIQFDHIIPISKGGATSVENLQLLCKQCNLSKGASI